MSDSEPLAIEALRRIAALAPRCSEDECDDNYEAKGAHRLATHQTTLFGAPVYLCAEHATQREASHRKAKSKGCGKQPPVVPYVEENPAIAIALEALATIDGPK